MENSVLVGLSRQVALERQLGVVANNIANVNTTGYKADKLLFEEYLRSAADDRAFTGADRRLSFVVDRGTVHDFSQGPVERTGNPLDLALDGKAFFVVQVNGQDRYTRNGTFQINNQGQLVTNDGHQVMGNNGPVVFQNGDQDITIARDGTITVREGNNTDVAAVRGRLRLVTFEQPGSLQRQGASLFSAPNDVVAQPALNSGVHQGVIEKSNVNGVAEMSRMIEVMRAYTGIANLVQQLSEVRKVAIERLADVPA